MSESELTVLQMVLFVILAQINEFAVFTTFVFFGGTLNFFEENETSSELLVFFGSGFDFCHPLLSCCDTISSESVRCCFPDRNAIGTALPSTFVSILFGVSTLFLIPFYMAWRYLRFTRLFLRPLSHRSNLLQPVNNDSKMTAK